MSLTFWHWAQKFCVNLGKRKVIDIISCIQRGLNNCRDDVLSQKLEIISSKCAGIIKQNLKSCSPNLSHFHVAALRSLKRRIKTGEFLVTMADKGAKTVIISPDDYNNKLDVHFSDLDTYEKLPKNANPIRRAHIAFSSIVKNCCHDEANSKSCSKRLLPSLECARLPKPYGLIKIHKTGNPARLIIPMCGAIGHSIGKLIAQILKPAVEAISARTINSTDAKQKLSSLTLNTHSRLCSFDVISLFPSIDTTQLFEILPQIIISTEADWRKLPLAADLRISAILELCKALFNNVYFKYDGKCYRQLHGIPMGSPASVVFAEIYMDFILSEAIQASPSFIRPLFISRYIDDLIAIFNNELFIDMFFNVLNAVDAKGKLKFTLEVESDSTIAFLDLNIRRQGSNFEFSVYRKATHSERYIHPSSCCPGTVAKGVAKGMRLRALNLCSNDILLANELQHIASVLQSNGYNQKFINNCILRPIFGPAREKITVDFKKCIIMPYVPPFAHPLKQYLSKLGFSIIFKAPEHLRSLLFYKLPDSQKTDYRNVVYKIECVDCDTFYIGSTKRYLSTRLQEHVTDKKNRSKIHSDNFSAIAKHSILAHHNMPDEASVICFESNEKLLRIKESLYIECNKGVLANVDGTAAPLGKGWLCLRDNFRC